MDTVTLGWKMEVSCWQSKHLHPSLLCDHDSCINVFICLYTPFFHIYRWTTAFLKIILFCIIHPLLNSSCTQRWWLFCLLPCTASSALICKNDIGENVMMCLPDASPNASPEQYWQIYSVSSASSFSMDHVGREIKEEESWEMPNNF